MDQRYLFDTAITLAELRFGVAKSQSRRRAENEKMLDLFLARFPVMDFDSETAAAYGPIRAGLEGQGTPIGAMDMLIAAHALSLGTVIVTHKAREFVRVPRLPVENGWMAERLTQQEFGSSRWLWRGSA